MAAVTAILIVLLWAQPSSAQDRVIGLLTLPDVFGNDVCSPFKPESVPIHLEPNGARIGSIEVDQNWSFARGWMPAHADSGEPTVWFSSRGC